MSNINDIRRDYNDALALVQDLGVTIDEFDLTDPTDPTDPTVPSHLLEAEQQIWWQDRGDSKQKHMYMRVTNIPRLPQSGVYNFEIVAILHQQEPGWEWDRLDYKTDIAGDGTSKYALSRDFSDSLERVDVRDGGRTEIFAGEVGFDTRDINDGQRDLKLRLKLKHPDGHESMATLGFTINAQNGNVTKHSPARYLERALRGWGYYKEPGLSAYSSVHLRGAKPPNIAPAVWPVRWYTRSWELRGRVPVVTERHAFRLGMKAHAQPPEPGTSLLPDGEMWGSGDADFRRESKRLSIGTMPWPVGTNHPTFIAETAASDSGMVYGVMKLTMHKA